MQNSVINLSAKIKKIRFCDKESLFSILEVKSEETKERDFVASGTVGTVQVGENVSLVGSWFVHPKYGKQFKIEEITLKDFDAGNIKAFLTGGFLSGVGKELGERIYEKFGEETKDIFEFSPEKLLNVKGIGKKKLEKLLASWNEQVGDREALTALANFQLGQGYIRKILDKWKNPRDAVRIIKENPYKLATEVKGIGFKKADEIALALSFDIYSQARFNAAIIFALEEAASSLGHCFLTRSELEKQTYKLLNLLEISSFIAQGLEFLETQGDIVIKKDRVYLSAFFNTENALQENIISLATANAKPHNVSQQIKKFEQENSISLDSKQREAIESALNSCFHVITGGPGTGKTTIVKGLLSCIGEASVALAAPTGKAAKRMTEATGVQAQTIHRLLEYDPTAGGWGFNSSQKLPYEYVIVDEVSMLDIFIAKALTDAIKGGTKVIFIGDKNQLPSVSAGAVLRDLLASSIITRTCLTEIYRQSNNSFISMNAEAVINGNFNELNLSNNTDDFFWWSSHAETADLQHDEILRKVYLSTLRLLERGYNEHSIQILSPSYKTKVGIDNLNLMLHQIFNKENELQKIRSKYFAVRSKVMQLRNDYNKEVFNGDTGFITKIDSKEEKITVNFDGRDVEYDFCEISSLTLAYAISIHKSQGSESDAVITVLSTSHYIMLQRSLLYTAITRAKKMCVMIGCTNALKQAVRNKSSNNRNTTLLYNM